MSELQVRQEMRYDLVVVKWRDAIFNPGWVPNHLLSAWANLDSTKTKYTKFI